MDRLLGRVVELVEHGADESGLADVLRDAYPLRVGGAGDRRVRPVGEADGGCVQGHGPNLTRARSATSPLNRVPERQREALAGDFARLREQPLSYARTVLADVVHGFAVKRTVTRRRVPFEDVWTFQPTFPRREEADPVIRAYGGPGGSVQPQLVDFLRGYQRIAYTPGPLLAAGLLLALAAAAGIGRGRRSALRPAALLFASMGLVLYLAPALTQQLMPRYTLPSLVLLRRHWRLPSPRSPALSVDPRAVSTHGRWSGAQHRVRVRQLSCWPEGADKSSPPVRRS